MSGLDFDFPVGFMVLYGRGTDTFRQSVDLAPSVLISTVPSTLQLYRTV